MSLISRSRRRLRVVSVLVVAAFLNLQVGFVGGMFAGVARAQDKSVHKLAVKVYPRKASDAGLAKAFYVVLRKGADRLSGQGYVRASGIPTKAAAAIDAAWAHVNKGRVLLKEGKLADAYNEYSAAEASARAYMGYADRALVAQIYKGLGIGFVVASKPLQAKRAIKISLFAYPDQTKAEYSYNKEIENFFLSAQREIVDSPTGTVDVESIPEGAEVYVDFEFRGFSPLSIKDLTVGEHVVTFVADGYEPLAQLVEITGGPGEFAMGEMIELDNSAAIAAASDELGASLTGSSAAQKAGKYASIVGATDLLAITVGDDADSYAIDGVFLGNGQVQRVNYSISKETDAMAEIEGIFGRAMNQMPPRQAAFGPLEPDMIVVDKTVVAEEDLMVAESGDDLLIDPNSPLFKDDTQKKKTTVVDKWWFWTALIVGLGAVGGLTYWGVTSGADSGNAAGNGGIHINLGGVQ